MPENYRGPERRVDSFETNDRLNRIENKIDQLSNAMISIARAEEKLANIDKIMINYHERANRQSEKIDELSNQVEENTTTVSMLTKVIWIIGASVVGAIVSQISRHI